MNNYKLLDLNLVMLSRSMFNAINQLDYSSSSDILTYYGFTPEEQYCIKNIISDNNQLTEIRYLLSNYYISEWVGWFDYYCSRYDNQLFNDSLELKFIKTFELPESTQVYVDYSDTLYKRNQYGFIYSAMVFADYTRSNAYYAPPFSEYLACKCQLDYFSNQAKDISELIYYELA